MQAKRKTLSRVEWLFDKASLYLKRELSFYRYMPHGFCLLKNTKRIGCTYCQDVHALKSQDIIAPVQWTVHVTIPGVGCRAVSSVHEIVHTIDV